MDDDGAHGSLFRGAHVLVVPATVPEACFAAEEFGVPVRIVVHHQQDFAFEVVFLVVVPVVFRRLHAVADEHDFRILYFGAFRLHAAGDDVLVPLFERQRPVRTRERPFGRLIGGQADEFERLFPTAVRRARLEPHFLEFLRQVTPRRLIAAAARAPAFVFVVRQFPDVVPHEFRGNLRRRQFRLRVATRCRLPGGWHRPGGRLAAPAGGEPGQGQQQQELCGLDRIHGAPLRDRGRKNRELYHMR